MSLMRKTAVLQGKVIDTTGMMIVSLLMKAIRPNDALKKIFETAGLQVIKEDVQKGLPAGLFTVRM